MCTWQFFTSYIPTYSFWVMIRKVSALNSALIKDWMMADPTIFIFVCIQGLGLRLVRAKTSDDSIYFVRFELSLIPLIDWNLKILQKCHNYFDLYKLLLISKIHFGSPVLNTLLFLVSLGSLLCLSCPLQSWKQQHTNLLCIVRVTHLVFSDIILK